MNNRPSEETPTVSLPGQDEIARVRQQFETAWRAGLKNGRLPEVDAFLSMIAEPLHATLRQELTRVDHEYRQRWGNTGTAVEPPHADAGATIDHPDGAAKERQKLAAAGGTLDYVPDTNHAGKSPPTSTAPTDNTLDYPSPRPADPGGTVDGAALMRNLNNASFELARGIEAAPAREPGSVAGYEILEVLGRGAMGVVYKARQRGLKRIVALKMILAGDHVGETELARFRTEAEAAGQLQHPNIVQVYEVGEQGGCPFLSLEYINGGSLKDRLGGKPQPVLHAAQLVQVLAQTMEFAHRQGIIHRDLKPANVMLVDARASGSSESTLSAAPLVEELYGIPKIADFGLAKRLEEDKGHTRTGTILGTPSYMAPEQAEGRSKEVGPLADQYALGAVLYEVLTGRPPFQGATVWETLDQVRSQEPVPPSQLQPRVPRDLETICLKALQKEPHKRYATTGAMAEDLRRFLANEPILARPVSNRERLVRWCKRNPRLAASVSVAGLAIIAWACHATVQWYQIGQAKARAEEQRELASKQAQLAANTALDVVTKIDDALRDKAGMGQLRLQVLELTMQNLKQVARELIDSGKADRTMGVAFQRIGTFYEQMGQTDNAIQFYKDALRIFERLIIEQPEEERNKFNAAVCYDNLGEMGKEVEPEPAVLFEYYEKALKLREPLVAAYHNEGISLAERHRLIGVSNVKLGSLCLVLGEPAQALAYGHRAVAENEAAAVADPADLHNIRTYMSDARFLAGRASALLGAVADARRELDDCRKLRAEQVNTEPLNALAKQSLAATDDAFGDLALQEGELKAARRHYQKAHDLFEQLCQADKNNPEFRWYRSFADYHLGTVQTLLGDPAAAQQSLHSCLETRQALLKEDVKNPQRKIEVMLALARLGQHQQASVLARQVQEYAPHHPGMLFAVGCGYALCIPAAKDSATQRAYKDKATAALGQAVTHGFRAARELERAPDLEPLHGVPAYKSLIIHLAQK
jgi:serine/threonine-protein kinase